MQISNWTESKKEFSYALFERLITREECKTNCEITVTSHLHTNLKIQNTVGQVKFT